jgi:arabinogalactan endo-1,4-beta-galactosidase
MEQTMRTRLLRAVFVTSALYLAGACGTSSTDLGLSMDASAPSSSDGGLPVDGGSIAVDGGSTALDGSSSASTDASSTTLDGSAATSADGSSVARDGGVAANESGTAGTDASLASYWLGADVSFVQQEEADGRLFYDTDGTQKDIFQILKNHGFNYVRLRTFVNPLASDGYDTANGSATAYCDAAHTATMGARIKAAGLGFLLDFHYSDNWADPGKQCIPVAWQGYTTIAELETALQNYTNATITQLVAAGARPDWVEVGNEITPGMLFDICNASGLPTATAPLVSGSTSNWTNLAGLLNAGIAGVKAVDSSINIMMHIDRGGDNAGTRTWVDNAMSHGVSFDALGESCYTNFQGDPSTWQANFADLVTRYPALSFVIAEYAEDSADLAGNSECANEGAGPCNVWRRANDIAFGIPGKKGLGTFVWEPTEYEETLFDNQNQAKTNDPANLPNPFATADAGARIQLYDQMVTAYGL